MVKAIAGFDADRQQRAEFDSAFSAATVEASRIGGEGACFGLMVCDIDSFELLNERHGHHWGDSIIATIEQSLAQAIPDGRMFRMGGRFVVLSGRCASVGAVKAVADRVVAAGRVPGDPPGTGGPEGLTSISSGLVLLSPEVPLDVTWSRATDAMYVAKAEARGEWVMPED